MSHQFELFGYQRPKKKVAMKSKDIETIKDLIDKGKGSEAAIKLRELREGLERKYGV